MTFGVLEIVLLPRKKRKNREEKSHFFFSLCGFVWLLRNEFCEGKMKGKNKKSDF